MQQTLNACQDSSNVVRRAPSILKYVQAKLAIGVDIRMKHAREELDGRRFIWVALIKGEQELKGAVFERSLGFYSERDQKRRGFVSFAYLRNVDFGDTHDVPGPKITAFQSMMFSGHGLPEIPPGGSVERRLKSRMRRRRAVVD